MPSFPEQELLKACVRDALEPSPEDEVLRHLRYDISWERFLHLADRNDVLSLVYQSCSRFETKIPRQVLARMGEKSASIAAWNLTLAVELVAVLEEFQKNAIPAVPFKGPALALALYGQLGKRQCRDLDIFIEPKHLWTAVELLRTHGYRTVLPPGTARREEIFQLSKDVTMEHPSTGICVELHWAVCEPSFDPQLHAAPVLCQRAQPVCVLGRTLFIPSPEDLLFILCVHGARHYWESLKWLCDITQLIRTYPDLDWDLLLRTVDRFRQRRALWIAVRLAHEVLSIPLPSTIQSLIERDLGSLSPTGEHLFPNVLSNPDECIPHENGSLFESKMAADADIKKKLARLRSKDRISDRLAFAFHLIRDFVRPDKSDLDTNPVRRRSECLFWIIQPVRLIQAHGLAFIFRTSRKLIMGVVR